MQAERAATVPDVPALAERLGTVERCGRVALLGGMAGPLDRAFAMPIGRLDDQVGDAALLAPPI